MLKDNAQKIADALKIRDVSRIYIFWPAEPIGDMGCNNIALMDDIQIGEEVKYYDIEYKCIKIIMFGLSPIAYFKRIYA